MGKSVTKIIKEISQPKGGYIKVGEMEKIQLKSDNSLNLNENLGANIIGMTVDYLTRFMITGDAEEAFEISLLGAEKIDEDNVAYNLIGHITGLNKESIRCACKLVGYDVCFRSSIEYYKPVDDPDEDTIFNIKEMVERSLKMFDKFGVAKEIGFTFDGGYTSIVDSGDGDYLTENTLWDFKVSKKEPDKDQTMQILMYYLMGLHSINCDKFKSIKYLGIYNPRLNVVYRYDINKLSDEIRLLVEKNIIGY